jgi:plasmid replication initiation protein
MGRRCLDLGRLQAASIVTNIRAQKGKKHRPFSWIESWTGRIPAEHGHGSNALRLVPRRHPDGGGLLSIDPVYFTITGGRERWLYRIARKHAGGAGEEGFAISLPTLFEKSGAEGAYRRFKFEMQAIVRHNDLPGFDLSLEFTTSKEPSIRMCRRAVAHAEGEQVAAGGKIRRPSATDYRAAAVPAAVQQPERDAGARRPWLHAPARRRRPSPRAGVPNLPIGTRSRPEFVGRVGFPAIAH